MLIEEIENFMAETTGTKVRSEATQVLADGLNLPSKEMHQLSGIPMKDVGIIYPSKAE
jgi:hypothetical protein